MATFPYGYDLWWIDEDRLAGGANPSIETLRTLRGHGFATVISLLDEPGQPPGYPVAEAVALGYARHNLPIRDFGVPMPAQFDLFYHFLGDGLRAGKVLVHCHAGVGRTGLMAAAYWMRRARLAAPEAIERVRRARPGAVETRAQLDALAALAARLADERG